MPSGEGSCITEVLPPLPYKKAPLKRKRFASGTSQEVKEKLRRMRNRDAAADLRHRKKNYEGVLENNLTALHDSIESLQDEETVLLRQEEQLRQRLLAAQHHQANVLPCEDPSIQIDTLDQSSYVTQYSIGGPLTVPAGSVSNPSQITVDHSDTNNWENLLMNLEDLTPTEPHSVQHSGGSESDDDHSYSIEEMEIDCVRAQTSSRQQQCSNEVNSFIDTAAINTQTSQPTSVHVNMELLLMTWAVMAQCSSRCLLTSMQQKIFFHLMTDFSRTANCMGALTAQIVHHNQIHGCVHPQIPPIHATSPVLTANHQSSLAVR